MKKVLRSGRQGKVKDVLGAPSVPGAPPGYPTRRKIGTVDNGKI